MSDLASVGSPDAPVSDAASTEEAVQPPLPLNDEPHDQPIREQEKPKPEDKKPATTREALQRAREKVETDTKEPAEKQKSVDAKPDRDRSEDGKFKAKDGAEPRQDPDGEKVEAPPKTAQPASDAPSRFSADAKAAWSTTPDPVKAETSRAFRELETGIQKYRADAEEFAKIKPFHDLAVKNGGNLHASLTQVVAIENAFQQGPLQGMQKIADHFGFSLKDMAAHIMGQTPEQQSSAHEAEMRSLRQNNAALEQKINDLIGVHHAQQRDGVVKTISDFSAQPGRERFDELAGDIALFLQSGKAKDLDEAYSLAERLNPAPAPSPEPVTAPAPKVHPDKGTKSITGAPSPGSDPVKRQPSSSVRESIEKARARAG